MALTENPDLPREWQLPSIFHKRIGARAGRQRAMVADGHLLLILRLPPEAKSLARRSAFFWRSPEGNWKSSIASEGLPSLRRVVEGYDRIAAQLEERLAKRPDAEELHEILQITTPLTRTSRNLHQALQAAREAVDDPDIINLRDLAGEAERILDMVRQEARHGLQFLLTRRAGEQAVEAARLARAGYKLNLLAAVFLPVAAIAALFGMNLSSGVETTAAPFLFWIVAGLTLLSGWFFFRWSRHRDGGP